MRTILALLVVACCWSNSDATFRHIKAKLNSSPLLQTAIQYLAAPEPLPANYARPSYSSHVSTFSVAVPSVGGGIGLPGPGAFAAFPGVTPELLTVPPAHLYYHGPEVVVQPFAGQLLEQFYNGPYPPLNNYQIGNC